MHCAMRVTKALPRYLGLSGVMVEGLGFEPRLHGSEPRVLPLDDPSVLGTRYGIEPYFTVLEAVTSP